MKKSTERILTTHAGSLSRPANLIAINRARATGESKDDATYAQCLAAAVAGVVRKQRGLGVDIPDDGEFGKPMAANYDYGVWWNYAFARMEGFAPAEFGSRIRAQKIERRRACAHLVLQSPRLAEIRRILSGPGIERQPDGQRREAAYTASGLHRANKIRRAGRDRRRHRQSEEGARRGRRRGRLHVFDRPRQLRPRRGCFTTRPRRNSSSPPPRRCARSTRRSSTPASCCRSTTRACRITGT